MRRTQYGAAPTRETRPIAHLYEDTSASRAVSPEARHFVGRLKRFIVIIIVVVNIIGRNYAIRLLLIMQQDRDENDNGRR